MMKPMLSCYDKFLPAENIKIREVFYKDTSIYISVIEVKNRYIPDGFIESVQNKAVKKLGLTNEELSISTFKGDIHCAIFLSKISILNNSSDNIFERISEFILEEILNIAAPKKKLIEKIACCSNCFEGIFTLNMDRAIELRMKPGMHHNSCRICNNNLSDLIFIDIAIYEVVQKFNRNLINTKYCCASHEDDLDMYILFDASSTSRIKKILSYMEAVDPSNYSDLIHHFTIIEKGLGYSTEILISSREDVYRELVYYNGFASAQYKLLDLLDHLASISAVKNEK